MSNIMSKKEALAVLDIIDDDIQNDTYGLSWNELVDTALTWLQELKRYGGNYIL